MMQQQNSHNAAPESVSDEELAEYLKAKNPQAYQQFATMSPQQQKEVFDKMRNSVNNVNYSSQQNGNGMAGEF